MNAKTECTIIKRKIIVQNIFILANVDVNMDKNIERKKCVRQ